MRKIAATLAVLSIIFFSCNRSKSPIAMYGPEFENIMRSDAGVFRGFSLGDKPDSIQAKESGKPVETDDGYLYYEYKLAKGSYNITYNFDERGLSEVQSDIFITNPEETDGVFNKFKTYFDEHYGASQTDMGYIIWSVKSEKFGEVKINLRDESAAFTADKAPGKISLSIYPNKE